MAKLTKKSYQRKAMVMGGVIFASCALFATGFAAFVVSSSASNGIGGSVNVGTISDASITIDSLNLTKNAFSFDAKEGDNTGRVRCDGTNFENLSTTVSGKFSPSNYVNEFTVELRIGTWNAEKKDVDLNEAAEKRIDDAITKKYIVAPTCWKNPVKLTFGTQITEAEEGEGSNKKKVASFSYEIAFKWGAHFAVDGVEENAKNPSEFYDETGVASTYPDTGENSYLNDLNKFYKTMTGVDNGSKAVPEMKFCVKLVASTSGSSRGA